MTNLLADLWVAHPWLQPQVVVAYLLVILAHYPMKGISDRLWGVVGLDKRNRRQFRPQVWTAGVLGVVERPLYLAALQALKPQFIGVWLAFKAAGTWQTWTQGIELSNRPVKKIEGGTILARFLIGNGLSIACSAVAWKIIQYWQQGAILAVLLLAGMGVLSWFIGYAKSKW